MSPHGKEQLVCPTCCPITFPYFNSRSRTGNDPDDPGGTGKHVYCFNPRSRTGNDGSADRERGPAPPRFNPRSRTGNDEGDEGFFVRISQFQSTFPHGERPEADMKTITDTCMFQSTFPHGERRKIPLVGFPFNPRSRTGNDRDGTGVVFRKYLCFNPRSRTGNDKISKV